MITPYGKGIVRATLALSLIIIIIGILAGGGWLINFILFIIALSITTFVLNFFRDPDRNPPDDERALLSPADGKVILIKELFEEEYLHENAIQVSIFMSPLNVHVNRIPMSGIVGHYRYIKGEYLVAFNDKSSERNERTHIGIEDHGFRLLFKQIAGTVARRIIAEIIPGQRVERGQRFGMIRFGSRVDVLMPITVELAVALNDRVRAGESILARRLTTHKGANS